jgi:signal transduction histidine kinase
MKAWRDAIRRDPTLTSGDSLPRAQLNDHIPSVLVAFERELGHGEAADQGDVASDTAAAHGMHRWQQGYDLREVVRELGALNVCVVTELEHYAEAHPQLDPSVLREARGRWASACSIGIEESAAQYFRLQQAEAAGHLNELEKALDSVRELERQRADLWREIAHDLRGNVGVVSNATAGLAVVKGADERADRFLRMLQRNVGALHHLLDDVTDLARLQAGREERTLSHFDVDALMSTLCEGLLPLAQERGLFLHWKGPPSFSVEGDDVKLRRLAQNLVLNAIKYTRRGGVTLTWGDSDSKTDDRKRWLLSVEDTGPGMDSDGPMAGALQQATQLAHDADGVAASAAPAEDPAPDLSGALEDPTSPQQLPQMPVRMPPQTEPQTALPIARNGLPGAGEGIGLSIVKRLSEMLDAAVELDSTPGRGTAFRVLLPRRYAP